MPKKTKLFKTSTFYTTTAESDRDYPAPNWLKINQNCANF